MSDGPPAFFGGIGRESWELVEKAVVCASGAPGGRVTRRLCGQSRDACCKDGRDAIATVARERTGVRDEDALVDGDLELLSSCSGVSAEQFP